MDERFVAGLRETLHRLATSENPEMAELVDGVIEPLVNEVAKLHQRKEHSRRYAAFSDLIKQGAGPLISDAIRRFGDGPSPGERQSVCVAKTTIRQAGSCNFCDDAIGPSGYKDPNATVFELSGAGLRARLCPTCMKSVVEQVTGK